MGYLGKFSIKAKLGFLFLILLCSIFILGYTALKISELSTQKMKEIHRYSKDVVRFEVKIISPLYKVREISHLLAFSKNKALNARLNKQLDINTKILDKNFSKFPNKHIISMWRNYKISLNVLKTKDKLADILKIKSLSNARFDYFLSELLLRQKKFFEKSTKEYQATLNKVDNLEFEILFFLVLILSFCIMLGWFISSNIISSIKLMQHGLEEFFAYLNHEEHESIKIDISSDDEVGQMAKMINENIEIIQKNLDKNDALIYDATRVLEDIKSGNLGTRLTKDTSSQSLSELKNMINNVISSFEIKIQREIKKRLDQEQILIQQSKLASMGEMIGNIAHQWRQPLAQISAIHMNMKITYQFEKFTKEYMEGKLKEANTLTKYMSETISDFQNFFHPKETKEIFSIEKACKDAYFIIESSFRYYDIQVEFNVIEDIEVIGYHNEFSQVILNIFSNAKDIFLEREVKGPKIKIEIKHGNSYAIIKIEDNGGGIKDEIITKIFEPYFTTRHKTQGTGIGLYMSKNIIERNMQGLIKVINKNKGACFIIKIPKFQKDIKNEDVLSR